MIGMLIKRIETELILICLVIYPQPLLKKFLP